MLVGKWADTWVFVGVCISEMDLFLAGYNQSRLVVNFAEAQSILIWNK